MNRDERALLEAAEKLGGYRAIEVIAHEARRRLETVRPAAREKLATTLVRCFAELCAGYGDSAAAFFLQEMLAEYQKQLRKAGRAEQAVAWNRAWIALGDVARLAKHATGPGGPKKVTS
jgi:hypothetical protein